MNEEQLRKIFNETADEFERSKKYAEIVRDFDAIAAKHSKDVATVMTAFELNRQFTFEVFKKIFAESSDETH